MSAPLLVRRSEINTILWDDLINRSDQRCVYGYSWYLDVVSPNWSALVWPSLLDYKVILPLPIVKKWGLAVIQQPFFCQYLGFFSAGNLSEELTKVFLEKLSDHFCYISSYNFSPHNTSLLTTLFPQVPEFITRQLATHWLDLSKSYSELQALYSKDKKENLRKSLKANWTIEISEDLEPLINLFKINHSNQITGGVSESSYHLLKKLYKELSERKLSSIIYATKNSDHHAGVLIVKEERQHIYLFNGADKIGRKGNARTFILDNYFQNTTETAHFFDFESPIKPDIVKNYLGFGAKEAGFYSIRKNKLPFPIRKWQEKRILKSITKM